jgi:hypothetical protein
LVQRLKTLVPFLVVVPAVPAACDDSLVKLQQLQRQLASETGIAAVGIDARDDSLLSITLYLNADTDGG